MIAAAFTDLLETPTRANLTVVRQTVKDAYADPNRQIVGFLVITTIENKLDCLVPCQPLPPARFKKEYANILTDSVNFTLQERLNNIIDLIEELIDNQCAAYADEIKRYHNMRGFNNKEGVNKPL